MPRSNGVYSEPAGTKGTPNTTIQSAPYNSFVDDLVADANAPRPVTAGGTGATSASAARAALGADDASNLTKGTVADARLPTTMSGKTFAGTVDGNKALRSLVPSSAPSSDRGFRNYIDGVEYSAFYSNNTFTVLDAPTGLRVTSPATTFIGGALTNSVSSAAASADRGYRFVIDGVELAALYFDNANMILGTSGTLKINGSPAVTVASLAASLSGVSGYQSLPNGFILQWGVVDASTSADIAITLPVSFPNGVRGVSVTPIGNPSPAGEAYTVAYEVQSNSSIAVRRRVIAAGGAVTAPTPSFSVSWMAWGS